MTGPLRVGLAGLGTVGAGVAQVLRASEAALGARSGRPVVLTAVSARSARDRGVDLAGVDWEDDPLRLAQRGDIDLVVELIGGEDGPARALVEAALAAKKHVVTANKALLAHHGAWLAGLAEKNGVALKFEAAVAGGVPIVKALRESLIAYEVSAVRGILNGTCNFILTQMEETGRPFPDVLAEAQALGYAEADPALDVGGMDTAHKLTLLASLAFGIAPDLASVSVSGIEHIMPADIAFAREFGYRVKLLGVARKTGSHVEQRVHAAMVKAGTPLADVDGSFNAVVAEMGEAGPFFFEGRGAGRGPTAAAVTADILEVARGVIGPAFGRPASALTPATKAREDARVSAYYLRFQVLDVPGVMAAISRHLADAGISIDSMLQRGRAPGEPVAIVMITHEAPHTVVGRALNAIAAAGQSGHGTLLEKPCMIPMENA